MTGAIERLIDSVDPASGRTAYLRPDDQAGAVAEAREELSGLIGRQRGTGIRAHRWVQLDTMGGMVWIDPGAVVMVAPHARADTRVHLSGGWQAVVLRSPGEVLDLLGAPGV